MATPWTVAHQTPLSMGFPRQEYWSGLPFLSPGDVPDQGLNTSPAWQVESLLLRYQGSPNLHNVICQLYLNKNGKKRKMSLEELNLGGTAL